MNSSAQSFIVTILLAAGALSAQVRTYDLGPAEGSRVALEVYKTRLMAGKKHVFVFERFSGEASFDEQKVRLVIESGSAVCTDTWVSEGDRKKILTAAHEVMGTAKNPQLVFASTKVTRTAENQYDIEGTLTIRGVAKPVLVRVTRQGDAFEGDAEVKLSNFGLKAPTGITMGFIGTKDEMKVLFRIVPRLRVR